MNNSRKTKDELIKDLNAAQRKLLVEEALERVRAQALGMQDSTEIGDVASRLFMELKELGYAPRNANIVLFDEEKNRFIVWFASDRRDGPWEQETLLDDPEQSDTSIYWARRRKLLQAKARRSLACG